jgi:hypothetical protein
MTPHFGDYYQNKGTPHDAGKPNPIPFLAVPARSEFRFVVTCDPARLPADCPDWKTTLDRIIDARLRLAGFRRQDRSRLRRAGRRPWRQWKSAGGWRINASAGCKQPRRRAARNSHPEDQELEAARGSIASCAALSMCQGNRQIPGRLVADRPGTATCNFSSRLSNGNPDRAQRGRRAAARSHQVDRLAWQQNASSSSRTG